jgi:hypothetical protein
METKPVTTIKTQVSFPISKKGPFAHDYEPDTTLAVVRAAAMTHFGVTDDAQFNYVLTHDGERQDDLSTTVGKVAGKAHAVEFRLVKVITQG